MKKDNISQYTLLRIMQYKQRLLHCLRNDLLSDYIVARNEKRTTKHSNCKPLP